MADLACDIQIQKSQMSITKRKSQSNFNRSSQTALNSDKQNYYDDAHAHRSSTQLDPILEKKSAD